MWAEEWEEVHTVIAAQSVPASAPRTGACTKPVEENLRGPQQMEVGGKWFLSLCTPCNQYCSSMCNK